MECSKCHKDKPETLEYFPGHKKTVNGLSSWCRVCNVAYTSNWKRNNQVKEKTNRRRLSLQRLYGITLEQYDEFLLSQNGGCKICERKDTGSSRCKFFHVDHDHTTGKVRGLLCNNCNRGIGYLADSPERLLKAAEYVRENQVSN
jgi:hypothetical protein